jgi:hypothetical protein
MRAVSLRVNEVVWFIGFVTAGQGWIVEEERKTMAKLTAHDFKPLPVISGDDDPEFKGVKAKYVTEKKLEHKLPEPVRNLFAKAKASGRYPQAYVLKLGHKEGKAYAIVSNVDSQFNEVRVVDKHGKTITKGKKTKYSWIED